MAKTVVIGASSGLGRCIGSGWPKRGDQVALLARRRERIENAAKEAGAGRGRDRMRRHRRGVGAVGDQRRGRRSRRHRQPRLHAGDRFGHAPRRHRRRHLGPGVRHQRHRRRDRDGSGRSIPDGVGGQGRLSVFGRGHLRSTVAGARRIRRQQGRAREDSSRRGAPSIPASGSPTSSSVNAQAATATRRRDSAPAGTGSSRASSTRSGFRAAACRAN